MNRTFWAIVGLVGLATLAGFAVYVQISALKGEVATLKRELATTKVKLDRVEKGMGDIAAAQNDLVAALSRTDSRGWPARAAITLSDDEKRLVRSVIKAPPPAPGAAPTINVDDAVPSSALIPLPAQLTEKLPKLKGARFTIDRNGAIAIVGPGGRVEVVISPS